jgi:hypothetical protein
LNSFSKARVTVIVWFFVMFAFVGSTSSALDITAFYIGSCNRINGIALDINSSTLKILSIGGRIVEIPRYEVNYVATYPADVVPFTRIENTDLLPPIRIMTRQNRRLVELLTGWPIEFTEDKISFLTTRGEGAVVDKSSIWKIEEVEVSDAVNFDGKGSVRSLDLIQPQTFASCPSDALSNSTARKIVAQQLLAEPVTIKREFDRIQKGHELIEAYRRRQKFYPVPNLYANLTALGLWSSLGSRYGSSAYRSNNFTPLVINERNTGPFSYQHQILTGSGPNPDSIHEEPQTQFSYRFKADYFQLSAMSDMSFLLIGDKYLWSRADLDDNDFRVSDVARLAMSIDYRMFSLALMPVDAINAGASHGSEFVQENVPVPRAGLVFRLPDLMLELSAGSGQGSKFSIDVLRLNAKYQLNDLTTLSASYIRRSSKLVQFDEKKFESSSMSNTEAIWLEHLYHERFPLGAFLSYESIAVDTGPLNGSTNMNARNFIKAGALVGLTF